MAIQCGSVLSISGRPYDRGCMYGSQARELINRNVQYYLNLWEAKFGLSRGQTLELAKGFAEPIGDYDSAILQEIRGIADGAGLKLEEILAVNARYEFSFARAHQDAELPPGPAGECTSLAAGPPATTDGHTYVGQNWDNAVQLKPICLLLEIQQDGLPTIVTHVEAGLVAHKGMNSAGLGACVNCLISDKDRFEPMVPLWVMIRGVLNSSTIEQAQQAVRHAQRAASFNCLIATDKGQILDLEVSPTGVRAIPADEGRLAHGNVFAETKGQAPAVDKFRALYPQLRLRYLRAGELLAQGQLDVEALQKIFSDHANSPESICRHLNHQPPGAPEALAWETITSIIMDLTERTIYLADGPPCCTGYKKLSLASLSPA